RNSTQRWRIRPFILEPFIGAARLFERAFARQGHIGVHPIVGVGDALVNRFGELHRGELALAQLGGSFVERQLGETHSMIFGTLKKVASRSGALARSASASGLLVTRSVRSALAASSSAWLKGSTCAVSS